MVEKLIKVPGNEVGSTFNSPKQQLRLWWKVKHFDTLRVTDRPSPQSLDRNTIMLLTIRSVFQIVVNSYLCIRARNHRACGVSFRGVINSIWDVGLTGPSISQPQAQFSSSRRKFKNSAGNLGKGAVIYD